MQPNKLKDCFNKIKDLKVCVIGDTIIDRYMYGYALGTASKDPVISTRKTREEYFAGGSLATANHISNFVKRLDLITILGENNSYEQFIKNHLSENINPYFFYRKESATIIKTRFLEEKRFTKLFKYENTDGKPIDQKLQEKIRSYLNKIITKYDIITVNDFGHGFLTKKIRKYIVNNSPYLALNVQTNSSNFGFNPLSKYEKADFVTLNQQELQMYFQNNEYNRDNLFEKLIKKDKYKKILLTASKDGVIYWGGKQIKDHKAFTSRPIDTVGAGDAVFSIIALLTFIHEDRIIPELANIIGAIAVETIGNKESVTRNKIFEFVKNQEKKIYELEQI
jgi:rfaE bifunctional protein kinase chain/domain